MSIFFGGGRKRRRRKAHKSERERQVVFWFRVVVTLSALLLLAMAITGIQKVTRHPSVTVSEIIVTGGETISHSEVQSRAEILLKGNYFFLIPRTFSYTYPHNEIKEAVSLIPRVRSVDIEQPTRTSLHIQFDEFTPHALWCHALEASGTGPCLFLDERGYAFSEAPQLSGAAFLRYVVDEREPSVGETAVEPDVLRTFEEFIDALFSEHDMRVTGITLHESGDVIYHVAGGGDIVVTQPFSVQDVFDTLNSVLQSEEFGHVAPGNFEYIDLRFDNKVLIKEVGEAEESEEVGAENGSSESVGGNTDDVGVV